MLVPRGYQLINLSRPALASYLWSAQFQNCRFLSGGSRNDDNDVSQSYWNSLKKMIEMVVTSLRVDRVAASGLGLPRRKIDHSLLAGHVFLNGNKVTKKSRQVVGGDIITRISDNQPKKEEIKFGQVRVVNIGELTKKGNYHIAIERNKSAVLAAAEFWKSHK